MKRLSKGEGFGGAMAKWRDEVAASDEVKLRKGASAGETASRPI